MNKLMLGLAAAALVGCLHTQQVDRGGPVVENPAPAAQPVELPTSSPAARPPVEEGRPELSVSPAGLMLPDGPRLIQQALRKLGYLSSDHQTGELDPETSAAIRKFQADRQVAKTGSPDRETVRKLGLSVELVFRSSKS